MKKLLVVVILLVALVSVMLTGCDGDTGVSFEVKLPQNLQFLQSEFSLEAVLNSLDIDFQGGSGDLSDIQLVEDDTQDFGAYKVYTYYIVAGSYISDKFDVKVFKDFENVSIYPDFSMGAKTNFFVGDELDTTGWIVRFDYADGSLGSAEFDLAYLDNNDFDMSKEGSYALSLNIAGKRFDNALTINVQKYSNELIPQFNVNIFADSIEVIGKDIDAYEFRLYNDNFDSDWQADNIFDNLTPNTKYVLQVRYFATADTSASEIVSKEVVTIKYETQQPDIESIIIEVGYDFIKVQALENLSISLVDSVQPFVKENDYLIAKGLSANKEYIIQAVFGETSTNYPSKIATYKVRTAQKQAEIVVDTQSQTAIYDGMTQSLGFSLSDGTLVEANYADIKYYQNGILLDSMPVEVGVYTANITYNAPEYGILTLNNVELQILPREITITADEISKEYGDEDPELTYSVTSGSIVEGDMLEGSLARQEGENAGVYNIDICTLNNKNYNITFVPSVMTITKAVLTASVNDYAIAKGNEIEYSIQFTGFKNNEDKGVLNLSGLQYGIYKDSQEVVENELEIGEYELKASGITSDNYDIEYNYGKLMVIDVTANAMSVEYSKESKEFVASDNEGKGYEFEYAYYTQEGEQLGQAPINAGEYKVEIIIRGGELTKEQYLYSTITILPREISIKANDLTKTYGDSDPALTYSVTSGSIVDGDMLEGALAREKGENSGVYNIDISTLKNNNYKISFVSGTLTIQKATITAVVADVKVEEGEQPQFGISYSGFKFEDNQSVLDTQNLQYSIYNNDLAVDISELKLGVLYVVKASGIYADNYNIEYKNGTLQVIAKEINVSHDDIQTEYSGQAVDYVAIDIDQEGYYFEYSYYVKDNQEFLEGSPIEAGEYTVKITITEGGLTQAQYLYASIVILPREITITADKISKEYGDEDPEFTYSVTSGSIVNGDMLEGALARQEGENAGVYNIDVCTLNNKNYNITFVPSVMTITKAVLTASVNDYAIAKGNEIEYCIQFTGFKNNEDKEVLNLSGLQYCIYKDSQEVLESELEIGEYELKASGITSDNYDIEYNYGKLIVINVTANAMSVEYSKESKEFVASDNEAKGYEFEYAYYTQEGEQLGQAPINAGEYKVYIIIRGGELAKEQYLYSTITILPREISIKANDLTKTYGDNDPELTYSVTSGSLLDGDQIAGNLTRQSGENVGNYTIYLGSVNAQNYNITLEDSYLQIIPMEITVIAHNLSKGEGLADPEFTFDVEEILPFGDTLKGSLSRESGEVAGDYEITIGDLQELNTNYNITFIKAYLTIIESFAKFGYSQSQFVYRVGTLNDMIFDIDYAEGYDEANYKVYLQAVNVNGDAQAQNTSANNALRFSGEGIINVSLYYNDGDSKILLDTMQVEVVYNAKNAYSRGDINFTKGDVCLHSDIILTSNLTTIPQGKALYGNNYKVDATSYNPTYRYQALIVVNGLLENLQLIGRYAEDGFADLDEPDYFYKTLTGISLKDGGIIENCYLKDTRYPVKFEGTSAQIINTTFDGGMNSINIVPTGTIQKLTIEDCDFIQMPEGDNMPGIAIYIDNSNASNLTLSFVGDINFHCMLDKSTIEKMDTTYQTIVNGLWSDFSGELIHNINGVEYFNATLAQYKASESSADVNIEFSDDCDLKDKFVRKQKSMSVLGNTFTGVVWTHGAGMLTEEESSQLVARPKSYKNSAYSPLGLNANEYYQTGVTASIVPSQEYIYNYGQIKFEKYGQSMPYQVNVKQTSVVGGYRIDEAGKNVMFKIGTYVVTFVVQDIIDDITYEYTTNINIGDMSPAPMIVFTYQQGKGNGTSTDPFQWQGKEVGTAWDPDYDWAIDLFFGVYAFDSMGNALPRTYFTIEIMSGDKKGTVYTNTSEAYLEHITNNFESNGYYKMTVKYTVTDEQGKSVSATRYFVRNSYADKPLFGSAKPDNGTAPSVTRYVDNSLLQDKNIGTISMNSSGNLVVIDSSGQYVFASQSSVNVVYTDGVPQIAE